MTRNNAMKTNSFTLAALTAAALLTASCAREKSASDVPVMDIAASASTAPFSEVELTDVRITPLDTAREALFSGGQLRGVIDGNLIITAREPDAIFLFDEHTGRLNSVMSHKGQGPGEWSYLGAVFPDTVTNTIVTTSLDDRFGIRSLTDSLMAEGRTPRIASRRLMTGNPYEGYNTVLDTDTAMHIIQLTPDFAIADTLTVPDYRLGYYCGYFWNSSDRALLTVADTLYTLTPGKMTPMAVLNRGDKTITPAIEKKITDVMRQDFETGQAMWNDYINYLDISVIGDMLLVYSANPGLIHNVNFNIYRLTDGAHLMHQVIVEEKQQGIPVEVNGMTLNLYNTTTAPDGRVYAVLDEELAEGLPGVEPDQCAVVSFSIKPLDK